jgi:hypothetical protein
MKFEVAFGKKGKEDKVLRIFTNGWEQITYKDLLTIMKHFYENEDRLYPPPAKGSKYLLEALVFLRHHSVEETLKNFFLERKEATALHDFMPTLTDYSDNLPSSS